MSSSKMVNDRQRSALEGLFSVAGETDLAARVRPSSRRPGQTEQPPELDTSENNGSPQG